MEKDMKQDTEGFLGMMLEARIDRLLQRKEESRVTEALSAAEAVVAGLSEEQRKIIDKWLNLSMDMEAEDCRRAYLGGLIDGIWLAGKVYLAGIDGILIPERWADPFVK